MVESKILVIKVKILSETTDIFSMGECLSRGSSPTSKPETSNQRTGAGGDFTSSSSPKMSSGDNPVVVSARGKHTGTLIFLHGLGDTGHGWASSLAEIRSDNMRIVCPTAPTIPVTLNSGTDQYFSSLRLGHGYLLFAGVKMPAWFDLISLDPQGAEDEPGIKKAAKEVEKLITAEISSGVPAERILIGGFSQVSNNDSNFRKIVRISHSRRAVPWRSTLGCRPRTSSAELWSCRLGSRYTRLCSPWSETWMFLCSTVTATAIRSCRTSGAR